MGISVKMSPERLETMKKAIENAAKKL